MLFQIGLVFLLINLVKTNENHLDHDVANINLLDKTFAFWPLVPSTVIKVQKREASQTELQVQDIVSEGGHIDIPTLNLNTTTSSTSTTAPPPAPSLNSNHSSETNTSLLNVTEITNSTVSTNHTILNGTEKTEKNTTNSINSAGFDLQDPGVLKRSAIVFGGFALLAIAYYVFYRRKNNKNDSSSSHAMGDANQFRYGVLQSEDTRDKLELSRMPLTMESDDDDDDNLEIFDLEQKKKSLSYVNLQINDEEIVNVTSDDIRDEGDNLLLDIDDRGTDTLIDWSNNSNKSIL